MQTPIRQNSALAVASLVSGLLGWTLVPLIGSIVAIVTGHMARAEIRREPERLHGDGMALSGLILGYASIAVGLLAIAAFMLFFGGLIWLGQGG